jgi:antitoxin PrlF
MRGAAPKPIAYSKVSVGSQTVIPREVREELGLRPGDTLRYRVTEQGVLIDRLPATGVHDPFDSFAEWSGEADERAYAEL